MLNFINKILPLASTHLLLEAYLASCFWILASRCHSNTPRRRFLEATNPQIFNRDFEETADFGASVSNSAFLSGIFTVDFFMGKIRGFAQITAIFLCKREKMRFACKDF